MTVRGVNDACHKSLFLQNFILRRIVKFNNLSMIMSKDRPSHKLTFENRLFRFIGFDLLLGMGLAGIEMSESLKTVAGVVAIYLLITCIAGYGPIEMLIRKFFISGND
jgi:hypothetical protein